MNSSRDSRIFRYKYRQPILGERVFIHEQAHVSGDVTLGDDVSIWPMAVLRGDVNRITVGARCSVQDNCVLHVSHEGPWAEGGAPLEIGDDVTIGHGAILHGCTIGNRCLIGMGALIMDGVVVEDDAMIAGGAVVTPGKRVAAGTLWRGNPAREARRLSEAEIDRLAYSAAHYVRLKDLYLEETF